MNKTQKFAQHIRNSVFRRLEAHRRNYEKTMINDMDNLYRVIRKGDVILVEGNSENCNEFQVICSGMIAKAFQRVGYPIIPALDPIPINSSSKRHNPYGASLIMRHYSQVMPKHFDISPNFQIIKFNIIEGGEFNYKTLWSQTIFETRHPNRLSPKKRGEPAVIDDNLLPLSR